MGISDELLLAGVPSDMAACITHSQAFAALPEMFQLLVIGDMQSTSTVQGKSQ